MIETLKRLGERVINHQRHHWFIASRERKRGSSVLWFPNIVIFRSKNQNGGDFKKGFKSLVIVLSPIIGVQVIVPLSAKLPLGLGIPAFVLWFFLVILSLWGILRGRRDYKQFKQARSLQNNPTAETATEATEYLDAYQQGTRIFALRTILQVCEGSPGRIVKHLNQELSTVAGQLVDCLESENPEVRRLAAGVIMWFTRDYGEEFGPHAQFLSEKLEYPDSDMQADLAIALGNIGARSETPSEFAKVLTPAVKDEDADVRQAAAYALERLPCRRSAKMLKHLSEDSSPDVSEQARESLRALTA